MKQAMLLETGVCGLLQTDEGTCRIVTLALNLRLLAALAPVLGLDQGDVDGNCPKFGGCDEVQPWGQLPF